MKGHMLPEQGQEPPAIIEIEHEILPEYTDENVLFFLSTLATRKAFEQYGERVIEVRHTGNHEDLTRYERAEHGNIKQFGLGRFFVYLRP